MQNPFSYSFGMIPNSLIESTQYNDLLAEFSYERPGERAYMITGVRGSGKTVMLSKLAKEMSQREDWIVIDLNRERDLLNSLAANLYDYGELKTLAVKAKIDLSVFGIGATISKDDRVFDIELAIEKLLILLQKKGKKLLITMDEVRKSDSMKVFCQAFQRFIRKELPVYLVMTGLYKDIHEIKNMDGCTFLNRAPFMVLEPLDLGAIATEYKKVLKVDSKDAIEMAKLTMGYAFAYQVLGKLYFNKSKEDDLSDIELEFESELGRYSYNIMWNELSKTDRDVVKAMIDYSVTDAIKSEYLAEKLGFSSSMMNRYRGRLVEKGIINNTNNGRGYYSFALPKFAHYVRDFLY